MSIRFVSLACVSAMAIGSAYAAEDRGHVDRPGPDARQIAGPEDAASLTNPSDFSLDPYGGLGFTYRSKPIFTLQQMVPQIDSGAQERANARSITYSFVERDKLPGFYRGAGANDGVGPLSEAQRANARLSIMLWDDVIAPTYIEKNGTGADIRFANSADPAQAYAYYPDDEHGFKYTSDVFLADPALNWTNNWLSPNGYGLTTVVHELGHSIGHSHPGAYNFGPGFSVNYVNGAEYAQDSWQYSIMSYWSSRETGAYLVDWSTLFFGYPQTPLVHDIYVAQLKYGADTTTRTGDTVYGFNSNAGRNLLDFTKNPYPHVTLYDAGGNDTIDVSGFNAGAFIDLHQGAFSSASKGVATQAEHRAAIDALNAISGFGLGYRTDASLLATVSSFQAAFASFIAADTGVAGVAAAAYDNISIAYGVVIENATGTGLRDVLWGNEVANTLKGNSGNDVLNGYEGADKYYGGAGNDVFQLTIAEAGDTLADYVQAEDRIDVRSFGFAYIGGAAFSGGGAKQLRYANGKLEGDVNGDGVADLVVSVANLSAADLLL